MRIQAKENRPIICIYSPHPIAAQKLRNAIEASEIASEIKTLCYRSQLDQLTGELLLLDGCCDDRWPELALQWQRTGSKLLILISPDEAYSRKQMQALFLGGSGVVPFSSEWEKELLQATKAVLDGTLWISHDVLTEYFRRTRYPRRKLIGDLNWASCLTAREEQILSLLLGGGSNKELGNILGISERTVKYHVSNILQKTQVFSRKELIEKITTSQAFPMQSTFVDEKLVF